ncbi:MAG: hypothetical protein ACKOW9_00700, partial [Candidatus Paceibacterota bacterium]
NPIIEEAEAVLSDAEIREKAIRELLGELDAEKEEIAVRKLKLDQEIEEERQRTEIGGNQIPKPQPPESESETLKPKKSKKGSQAKTRVNTPPKVETEEVEEGEKPKMDQESWLTEEVNNFIAEFGLEEFLPEDFRRLKQEQQLKTIRDLKQRIVDIVKQEAKVLHRDAVNNQKARANIFGKLAIGVRETFKKESAIKNEEKSEFEKIKNTEEGRKFVAEQMKLLAEINGSQEIVVGANRELLIDYSEQLHIDSGTVQAELRREYNQAANAFRAMPYEWSLAKEGSKQKQDYDRAKDEYQRVVNSVLEVKRFASGQDAQAIKDMMEIQNSLMLEQFLNSHPEIEIEFGKLEQGAGKEQVWETIRRLAGVQNSQKVGLFAAGYAARTITKATLGAIATPIVGAVFGGIRAKFKAKETLVERRKEARYGTKDTSREAEKFVDADKMANHIDAILSQLEQSNLTDKKRLALEKRLQIRIDVAVAKIEEGLLNFGNSREAIAHQYRLTESLNRALVRSALFNNTVSMEISQRTNNIMSFRKEAISKAQQEYIEEQILMGAVRGAGIATAGYIVRAAGEEMGWWGGHEKISKPYAEEQSDSKPFINSRYLGEKPVAGEGASPTIEEEPEGATAEEAEGSTKPDNKSGGGPAEENSKADKPHVNDKPVKSVKQGTGSTEAKPRKIPSVRELKDLPKGPDTKAVVGEGGGITFAFKQQLEGNSELADALKKQIGFTGKIGTKAFYEALGKEFGYIKSNGEWIGVKDGNVAAYQFEKHGDEYIVTEYHKIGDTWKMYESHDTEGEFEGTDHEKEYEYFGKRRTVVEKKENTSRQLETPQKINRSQTPDGRAPQRISLRQEKNLNTKKPDGVIVNIPKPQEALYGDKKDIEWGVAPGPDGAPSIVEDFTLDGGKAIRLFADRFGYDKLSNAEVNYVGETYRYNLNRIFTRSEDWTDRLSMMSAPKLLRMNLGEEIASDKEELSMYIKMLNKETGLKPFNDGWLGNKENAKDYILRMLLDLEYKGKLDTFNRKFDEFMSGK